MLTALRSTSRILKPSASHNVAPFFCRDFARALSTAASVSWHKIVPTPDPVAGSPCSRSSHGVSFVGGGTSAPRLLVIGGEHIARTPIADEKQAVWAADYTHHGVWKWRSIAGRENGIPSLPSRLGHAQATIGEKIYIFGGRSGIQMDEEPLNDMWVLDASGKPGTEEWSEVLYDSSTSSSPPPEARSFHKMMAVDTDLYIFGGCSASGRLADLHKFDTATRTWTALGTSNVLGGRGGSNLITLKGGALAVVAGFAGEETNDGHMIASNGKWAEAGMEGLSSMRPRSVCVSASFPHKDCAIIFGGEVDPSDRGHEGAGGFQNDVVILDLESGAHKETIQKCSSDLVEWPEERGWSDGDVGQVDPSLDGESLFVFGGLAGDDKDPRRLDDLWECRII